MRYFVFMLCLLPLGAFAQDCKLLTETDPYTKETKLSSGFISLPGSSLTIDADSKEIDFFFVLEGKCFSDASTAYVYFEGSRAKLMFKNAGSMNCDGYFHMRFRNGASTPSQLQQLMNKKVTQVVFIANDKKETVVTFSPEQQQTFNSMAKCVVAEGKKLVR